MVFNKFLVTSCVIWVSFVVVTDGSCVDVAEHSLGLMGGWQYHASSEADEDFHSRVADLVKMSVKAYNEASNDNVIYEAKVSNGQSVFQEAYTQVCCTYMMVSPS